MRVLADILIRRVELVNAQCQLSFPRDRGECGTYALPKILVAWAQATVVAWVIEVHLQHLKVTQTHHQDYSRLYGQETTTRMA